MGPRSRLVSLLASPAIAASLSCSSSDGPAAPRLTDTNGTISVSVATSGADAPTDFVLALDDSAPVSIDANGSASFDASAGDHTLRLSELPDNCAVIGANPRSLTIEPGVTLSVAFEVECLASTTTPSPSNLAPEASISAPADAAGVPFSTTPGSPMTFTGSARDPEDGALAGASLIWTSNLDGRIGAGTSFTTSALSEGMHTVTLAATDSDLASGFANVLVVITPPPRPGFQITMRLSEGARLAPAEVAVLRATRSRMETVITGDVPDMFLAVGAGPCAASNPAIQETVDDMLLFVEVRDIDGPGGVLAAGGACAVREGPGLPLFGGVRFDSADFEGIVASNRLDDVFLHEVAHALGFATLWRRLELLEDSSLRTPGADTWFSGASATAAFLALGGTAYTGGNIVPVENDTATYTGGSLDSHWRESVLDRELMTPTLDDGANPLSLVTVGQFEDLGYEVDPSAADPFTTTFAARAPDAQRLPPLHLKNDIFIGPLWEVSPNGVARRIR